MSLLRSLISWLSKRFPEQVTVTKQDYTDLRQEVAELNRWLQGITDLNTRLTDVEKQVKLLNSANGFVNTKKGSFSLER
jgi:hypothetical protein